MSPEWTKFHCSPCKMSATTVIDVELCQKNWPDQIGLVRVAVITSERVCVPHLNHHYHQPDHLLPHLFGEFCAQMCTRGSIGDQSKLSCKICFHHACGCPDHTFDPNALGYSEANNLGSLSLSLIFSFSFDATLVCITKTGVSTVDPPTSVAPASVVATAKATTSI